MARCSRSDRTTFLDAALTENAFPFTFTWLWRKRFSRKAFGEAAGEIGHGHGRDIGPALCRDETVAGIDAEKAAKGKLLYTVTLSNDKVTFPLNRAEISDDAKAMIDEAVAPIVAENKGVFFEIEGHTDSAGPEVYNQKLGHDRAMAVRAYLHDKHSVALSRIEVISYGETKPVVDNKTRAARAQNRRVVVKIVE